MCNLPREHRYKLCALATTANSNWQTATSNSNNQRQYQQHKNERTENCIRIAANSIDNRVNKKAVSMNVLLTTKIH